MQNICTKTIFRWLNICIMFFFLFGFQLVPPIDGITNIGMQVLGVFIGCLWGWIFIGNIGWTSLVGIIAFGLTDYADMSTVFASAFGSNITVLVLCMLLIMAIMLDADLSSIIMNYMLTRKFIQGKPWMIVFMFLLACFIASIASLCTICAILFI